MSAKAFHDKVLRLMKEHHDWFNNSIPLIASENIPSPAVREAIMQKDGPVTGFTQVAFILTKWR
jgi:glycine hydroxymethyltransferase